MNNYLLYYEVSLSFFFILKVLINIDQDYFLFVFVKVILMDLLFDVIK